MKHLKIFEDFVNEGAFHVALFKARNEGAKEFDFKGKKFPVHPKKGEVEMLDEEKEKSLNEGAVKAFEMDVKEVINQIKKGYGWIDPSYIEQTWNEIANSVDFSIAPEEIVNRLVKAGLVYHDNGNDEKGKQVKSYAEVAKSLNEASKFGGPGGLSKEETLKVAEIVAKAISKVDGVKCTVNKKSVESDSFDLDIDGIEYDGGSYNIYDNGDVRNMALQSSPIYAKIDSTVDQAAAMIKKSK